MPSYEYHLKSPYFLEQARSMFPGLFCMGLSDESIEARYHLLVYLKQEFNFNGDLIKDIHGKPLPIIVDNSNIYWSLSHSLHHIAFIVADSPTGIDIAEIQERDPSIMDIHSDRDYELLGGKNWINFYILWTAKESIIKAHGIGIDDMSQMVLISKDTDTISRFAFQGKKYMIHTQIDSSFVFSFILSYD